MTPDEARGQLAAWRDAHDRRDGLVLAALKAGLEKMEVHQITSIARTTIDRIEQQAQVMSPATERDGKMSEAETTFILAYMDGGTIATMPVTDHDKFQPGVTSQEAWDAMGGTERAELAAKGSAEHIRARQEIRRAGAGRRATQGQAFGRQREAERAKAREWNKLPHLMYEGREDGPIEWERTSTPGTWKATTRNVIATERWSDDSNDWEQDTRPSRITGQPRNELRATLEEAQADADALARAQAEADAARA